MTAKEEAMMLLNDTGCDPDAYHFLTWREAFDDLMTYAKETGATYENDPTEIALELKEIGDASYVAPVLPKYDVVYDCDNGCWSCGHNDTLEGALDQIADIYDSRAGELMNELYSRYKDGEDLQMLWEDWEYVMDNEQCFVKYTYEPAEDDEYGDIEWYLDSDRRAEVGWRNYESLKEFFKFLKGWETSL